MNFEDKGFASPEVQDGERPEEQFEDTVSPEHRRESADHWLQDNALNLNNLYIRYMNKTLSEEDVKPGTYNRNSGVLIFNIGGKIGALPDNEKVMDMITESELRMDESVAVPHLNDAEVWGNESERNQNSAFKEWLETDSKFRN